MARKAGLTLEQVVETASRIADRDGISSLSLASVAAALGVRSPSLYSHVDGLTGLRRQVSLHAARRLRTELADSVDGLDGIEALGAAAARLRSFAHRHPGRYDSLLPAPTPEQDPEVAATFAATAAVVGSVLIDMGVDPAAVVPACQSAESLGPRLRRPRAPRRIRPARRHRHLLRRHRRPRDRCDRSAVRDDRTRWLTPDSASRTFHSG